MPIRGNIFLTIPIFRDPTWNAEDNARMDTLSARFPTQIPLVQCLVWKQKVPGLQYPPDVESALAKLM